MKPLTLIPVVLLLAACGGGGGSPQVTKAAAPAALSVVTIAMYGDSTTYGSTPDQPWTGLYHQSPDNEPASLQWLLQQKYGPVAAVENHGVPGSTCPELLYGTAPVTQTWAQAMASTTAQIVTMNCAINDAFLPGETDADFAYMYGQFAQIASQYGKTFVIMAPNPINQPHNARLWQLMYQQKVINATWGTPFVDQYDLIVDNVPNWQGMLPDAIHPDDNLYEIKATNSFAVISPMVGSLLK